MLCDSHGRWEGAAMISLFIVEICIDGIVRHHTDPSA